MTNYTTLLSESFERAAYAHKSAMENFRVDGFDQSVQTFKRSIDTLQILMSMQAANDQKRGHEMIYGENDFLNA